MKKVETEKKDEPEAKATPAPEKSKEEIEKEKAREAALKEAERARTVVAAFIKLANDGHYSKASDHLTPTLQKYFKSEISVVNGSLKSVLDEISGHGTIELVTYVNTTIRGEGADVEAEIQYQDGRQVRRSFGLMEIDDKWMIVLPVGNDAPAVVETRVQAAPAVVTTPAPAPEATPAPAANAAPPTPEQAAAAAQAPLVLAPGTETPAQTPPAQ